MKERDIKDRIRSFIDQVDRRTVEAVKKGVRKVVFPAAFGMGLALGAGCGGEDLVEQPAQTVQGKSDNRGWGGVVALYAAPFPERDAGQIVAKYAAPFPEADAGQILAKYAAPFPELDAGAAPEADAGEVVALYAAPFPEADAGVAPGEDAGQIVAKYAAPFPTPDAG